MAYMEPADEFDGYNDLDTSTSYFKAVHISMQRLNLYDELVAEGAELDIAAVFVKIGGHPPYVLRPVRKALLGHSGIDSFCKFTIAALRELPIRTPVDGGDGAEMQTVLYGYVSPTAAGGKTYACAREAVFQELLLALWSSINVDCVRDGLPILAGVADIDFGGYNTSFSDFRLCVYSLLSFATVGTGEQLIASAKSDVEGLRKVCRQDKARERKLAEKGIDNALILARVDQLRKNTDYCLPVSQVANSQGCGFLYPSCQKRHFFVDAKCSPENLKPLADRKNNILGVCVLCDTYRVLLSPFPLEIASAALVDS